MFQDFSLSVIKFSLPLFAALSYNSERILQLFSEFQFDYYFDSNPINSAFTHVLITFSFPKYPDLNNLFHHMTYTILDYFITVSTSSTSSTATPSNNNENIPRIPSPLSTILHQYSLSTSHCYPLTLLTFHSKKFTLAKWQGYNKYNRVDQVFITSKLRNDISSFSQQYCHIEILDEYHLAFRRFLQGIKCHWMYQQQQKSQNNNSNNFSTATLIEYINKFSKDITSPASSRNYSFGYHGTSTHKNVQLIFYNGFNPMYRSGQVYGPGEYFTRPGCESYSSSYARDTNCLILNALIVSPELNTAPTHKEYYVIRNPNPVNYGITDKSRPISEEYFSYCFPLHVIKWGITSTNPEVQPNTSLPQSAPIQTNVQPNVMNRVDDDVDTNGLIPNNNNNNNNNNNINDNVNLAEEIIDFNHYPPPIDSDSDADDIDTNEDNNEINNNIHNNDENIENDNTNNITDENIENDNDGNCNNHFESDHNLNHDQNKTKILIEMDKVEKNNEKKNEIQRVRNNKINIEINNGHKDEIQINGDKEEFIQRNNSDNDNNGNNEDNDEKVGDETQLDIEEKDSEMNSTLNSKKSKSKNQKKKVKQPVNHLRLYFEEDEKNYAIGKIEVLLKSQNFNESDKSSFFDVPFSKDGEDNEEDEDEDLWYSSPVV